MYVYEIGLLSNDFFQSLIVTLPKRIKSAVYRFPNVELIFMHFKDIYIICILMNI